MFHLTGLHRLAAPQGDGLRPEILELLAQRQAMIGGNVEDISIHLAEHYLQAGPHPVQALDGRRPDGILQFPDSKSKDPAAMSVAIKR